MGLLDIFGGGKKKEAEKLEWVEKLEPFKAMIDNYEDLKNQLLGMELDFVKGNVARSVMRLQFMNHLDEKWGSEIANKLIDEGVTLGISEEQFNDVLQYKCYTGEEVYTKFTNDFQKLPYSIRTETESKGKLTVTRNNAKSRKNPNKIDYTFIDDKLAKIKTNT